MFLKARVNSSKFVVATVFVALLLLVALVPEAQAARVPAQKALADSGFKTTEVTCDDVRGELDFHLQCSGNAFVTGDADVIHGGWLDVTGTLTFTTPSSLEVWQAGKFSVDNGVVQTNSSQGYHVIVYPGGIINLTNADVSGSAEFVVESLFAGDANILGVYYHDNAKGLVITGQNALVDAYDGRPSKFYDNNNTGLELWDGRSSNVVKNSEFYGTAPGKQSVGILVKSGGQVIGGNNNIHDNAVGVLLERAGGNQILNNNIHGNVKAGIKSFVPGVVPNFVPPNTLYDKTPVLSSVSQPGSSMDAVHGVQPNTFSGNSITGNGDGIQEYVLANNIDAAQAQLISNNNGYGFVGVDEASRSALEGSVGVNGVGKALYLASTSVGAWIYYYGAVRLPDEPFYAAFCEGDIYDCDIATHSDARHYDDYTVAYTRQVIYQKYFTSDLMNTSEIKNIRGNATTFTPKFLARDHSVDNSGTVIHYCADAAHGYPYFCSIRAVSLTRYGDWLGRSSEDLLHPAYYIFYDDGIRPNCNWWGALDFGGKDDTNKQKENEKNYQSNGRRPAVKIPLVPEIRAVTQLVPN